MTTSAAFLSLLVALSLRMRCSTTLSRGLSAAIPWDRSQGCCTQRRRVLLLPLPEAASKLLQTAGRCNTGVIACYELQKQQRKAH